MGGTGGTLINMVMEEEEEFFSSSSSSCTVQTLNPWNFQSQRMYRTLPAGLRGRPVDLDDGTSSEASNSNRRGNSSGGGDQQQQQQQQNLFGLHLNLGLSSLISGGMNLLGQFRRRTPSSSSASTPVQADASPPARPSASEAAARLGRADSGASSTATATSSSSVSTTASGGGENNGYYEARGEHIELVRDT